jgi:hypothetical protein
VIFRRIGELAARFRWYVLGAWVVVAVVLNIVVPQLSDVIKHDTMSFLPADSEVMQGYRISSEKFNGSNAGGDAIVVMENTRGISSADRAYYPELVARIRACEPSRARRRRAPTRHGCAHSPRGTSRPTSPCTSPATRRSSATSRTACRPAPRAPR